MLKRIFDFLASAAGLVFLSPFFLVIALWIKLDSRGPVFFRQERVGRFGVNFRIHKFRTMVVDAESSGRLTVGADSRVTRSGALLRKYKLDELPQLIDVLFGRMSLVGPRPEVPEFIKHYPDGVKEKVLSVRPGITDLASIEMVDESEILDQYDDPQKAYVEVVLPIKQKFYEGYVDRNNFTFDLYIIFKTLWKILVR